MTEYSNQINPAELFAKACSLIATERDKAISGFINIINQYPETIAARMSKEEIRKIATSLSDKSLNLYGAIIKQFPNTMAETFAKSELETLNNKNPSPACEKNMLSGVDKFQDCSHPDSSQQVCAATLSYSKDTTPKSNDYPTQIISHSSDTITPILIAVNVFVFIIMAISTKSIFSFDVRDLVSWGANYEMSYNRQYWRLIAACFLHGGILHLTFNMIALNSVGGYIEAFMGSTRYLVAYLSLCVVASLSSFLWHESVVSVGASGAIFGLYGLFYILLKGHSIERNVRDHLMRNTMTFVGYNLIFGFLTPGIDNAAHLGGLISGLLLGNIIGTPKLPFGATISSYSLRKKAGYVIVILLILIVGWFSSEEHRAKYKFAGIAKSLSQGVQKVYNGKTVGGGKLLDYSYNVYKTNSSTVPYRGVIVFRIFEERSALWDLDKPGQRQSDYEYTKTYEYEYRNGKWRMN